MDSISKINEALAYIEANLTEKIDFQKVAKIALTSEHHFKRMFSFLAGVSLSEYIRRRRLTLAGLDLKNSDMRIIDVAVKYDYTSADAFSRAFQSMHEILPSEARREDALLKSYPPMTFRLSIEGGVEMNYRIVEKEAFKIIGLKKRVPIIFEGVNPAISELASLLTPAMVQELKELSNTEPRGMISASTNFSEGRMEEKGELDHYIGVATTQETETDFEVLSVQVGTWAVFESVGPFPETLQQTWGRIYSEWFPSSGYETVTGPEILWNDSPDTTKADYRSEIWIPVVKNKSDPTT